MDQLPQINYLDTLDNNLNVFSQGLCGQNIQGGYVEFSISEETYVHFFTSDSALHYIEYYLEQGKPLKGLRQYIRQHYAPHKLNQKNLTEEQIIIWNYEFDLSVEPHKPNYTAK